MYLLVFKNTIHQCTHLINFGRPGNAIYTAQKAKFSIEDFFSKCNHIWSHLQKKSLIENFIFYAVLLIIIIFYLAYWKIFNRNINNLNLTLQAVRRN